MSSEEQIREDAANPGEEIRSKFYAQPQAPRNVKCYNPAFDVTDAQLISGIVTEKGVFRYPYTGKFQKVFGD